jgi:hypothetical protein
MAPHSSRIVLLHRCRAATLHLSRDHQAVTHHLWVSLEAVHLLEILLHAVHHHSRALAIYSEVIRTHYSHQSEEGSRNEREW